MCHSVQYMKTSMTAFVLLGLFEPPGCVSDATPTISTSGSRTASTFLSGSSCSQANHRYTTYKYVLNTTGMFKNLRRKNMPSLLGAPPPQLFPLLARDPPGGGRVSG